MVEICPFCGNDYYSISNPTCHGCGGEIRERMYCPNCGGFHIFTVKEPQVGCWCCSRIYNSSREYDEYKKNEQDPIIKGGNFDPKKRSVQNKEQKAIIIESIGDDKKMIQVKEESGKPEEEEPILEKNLTGEKENILDEEEPSGDIDPSEILNYLEQFSGFLPKLEEKREYLEKRAHQIKNKISDVESSILKLEEEKDDLHDEIEQMEEDIAKIDKIGFTLQRIVGEKKPTLTAVSKN